MSSNVTVRGNSSGIWGLAWLVTIVFVILKFVDVIDWSWWWVFSPLLIALGLNIVGLIIVLVGLLFAAIVAGVMSRSRR